MCPLKASASGAECGSVRHTTAGELAASAKDDLLRATYLDIARNYRELAQLRAQQRERPP
jgi:hypothetical protein